MEAERRHACSMEETKESKTRLQENHAYHGRTFQHNPSEGDKDRAKQSKTKAD